MAQIEVRRTKEGEPYEFTVTVEEGGTATQRRLTLRYAADGWLSRATKTGHVAETLSGRQAGGTGQGVVPPPAGMRTGRLDPTHL